MIYWVLYFLRGTRSANILFGITLVLGITALMASALHLTVLKALLSGLWPILGMAVIMIFLPEIRRVLAQTGS